MKTGDSCFYSPVENVVVGAIFIKLPFMVKTQSKQKTNKQEKDNESIKFR